MEKDHLEGGPTNAIIKAIVLWTVRRLILWLYDKHVAEIDKILKAERGTHLHFNPKAKEPGNVEKMVEDI
jgi:hypothetical protein